MRRTAGPSVHPVRGTWWSAIAIQLLCNTPPPKPSRLAGDPCCCRLACNQIHLQHDFHALSTVTRSMCTLFHISKRNQEQTAQK